MAERTKTGNALLDAWIEAFASVVSPQARTAASTAAASGAEAMPSANFWERMFFGDLVAPTVGGFADGTEAAARSTELWSDLAQRSVGVIAALGSTANVGDPLGEALEQSFGVMGEAGGAATEGPALLAESAKAWSFLCAARERYRAFMFATWQRALAEVTREATRLAREGEFPGTPAKWLSFSNAVADRVFVEAFHSQAFIDAQRQLSSALADQRRSEMKLIELFARFGLFPTRRALDEVSAEVSELRRRVRQLERANRGVPQRRRKTKAADER